MNAMQLHLDGPPYTYVSDWITGAQALRKDFPKFVIVDLKKNEYELYDSLLYFGATPPTSEGEFYNLNYIHQSEMRPNINNQRALFTMMLSLHPTTTSYVRFCFTLFNALEDYGGILEVIISFFAIFVMPYTSLNFNMTAMSQFYLVRSKVQDFLARGMPSKVHSD
jgi:hypothetical protein